MFYINYISSNLSLSINGGSLFTLIFSNIESLIYTILKLCPVLPV